VTGATKALQFGLGPVQAILLGTITGVGGGMLRDVLLRQVVRLQPSRLLLRRPSPGPAAADRQ
jgi:uncharacterized membrane protein YeiH